MAFLLEQELFAPSCLPRQAREHLLKAEAAGAHKYSSTGLVLDCEFQIVRLSSTLCGTAKSKGQIQKRQ